MRIPILTQSFPNRRYPIDSEFLAALATACAGMGHQVRVLTVRYRMPSIRGGRRRTPGDPRHSDGAWTRSAHDAQDPVYEERGGFAVSRSALLLATEGQFDLKEDAAYFRDELAKAGVLYVYSSPLSKTRPHFWKEVAGHSEYFEPVLSECSSLCDRSRATACARLWRVR